MCMEIGSRESWRVYGEDFLLYVKCDDKKGWKMRNLMIWREEKGLEMAENLWGMNGRKF